MSLVPLQQKTVRPGSLVGYSYYRSNRQPVPQATDQAKKRQPFNPAISLGLIVIGLIVILGLVFNHSHKPNQGGYNTALTKGTQSTPASQPSQPTSVNPCQSNSLSQLILVSISKRELWACQTNKLLYESPVITGMSMHPDTITPTGTYHIYAKETNTILTGSDSTGSWSDPVSYWMPFLSNQYGSYGLHDATWRSPSQFGNVSPDSSDASHGCVELPLATANWLYNWAQVGTTVTIEN